MKKQFLCVFTLVLLILLLFVSCSGSLTDTLLKVMDGTDTNAYIKTGIVKPSTEAVDKVLDALTTETTSVTVATTDSTVIVKIGGKNISVEVSDAGLKELIKNGGVIAPQTEEKKAQLTASINEAISSPTSKEQLAKELSKDVTDEETVKAIQGTYALGSSALSEVSGKDGIPDNVKTLLNKLAGECKAAATATTGFTEADKAQAQLIANAAASAVKASSILASNPSNKEDVLENEDVKELLNDTLTLYNAAKIATGKVDILASESIINELISSFGGNNG